MRLTQRPIHPFKSSVLVALLAGLLLTTGCNRESPDDRFARLMKEASEFSKQSKFEEARLKIQSAVDAKPQEAAGYYELAEVLVRQQKLAGAIENYRSALNYNPKHKEARYHLAALLLAGRQVDMAEDHIVKLYDAYPQDEEIIILKANLESAASKKNYEEAKRLLNGVLAKNPKSGSALASLGGIALNEGDLKAAEEFFVKALKNDADNGPIQVILADLYARQGRLDEAEAMVAGLVKGNPENSALRFGYGEFLLKRGSSEKAVQQYEEILKADPLKHEARDRLYDIRQLRGTAEEVQALTDSLIKTNPNSPGVAYFKGRDAERAGNKKAALEFFLTSIQGLSTFAPAFRRAGLIEISLGDERNGLEHLNQAVTIDPGDVGARIALARDAMTKRDLARSSEHVNQVLQRFPNQLGANILRADIALLEGNTAQARKVYQILIDRFPKVPAGYFKLALLEEKEKNFDASMELYRKVISFDRGVLVPLQRLSTLLNGKIGLPATIEEVVKLEAKSKESKPEFKLMLGTLTMLNAADPQREAKARALLNEAIEGRPDLTGAYFALAALDAQKGDANAAADNYEKLIAKNPKHIPSLMLLAMIRERQERYEDAAKQYRAILSVNPRFGPAANNLAWLMADKLNGDLEEALKLAQTAKEVIPNEGGVADTLGWVYFKKGSARAALPYIEEALESDQKAGRAIANPDVLGHLAEVKFALGDKEGAKQAIDEALKIVPQGNPARATFEAIAKKVQ